MPYAKKVSHVASQSQNEALKRHYNAIFPTPIEGGIFSPFFAQMSSYSR